MKLKRGLNLGGYLSQCTHNPHHYSTFIGKADIEQIAAWGFDHIRLPVDYEVFEDKEGNRKEEGYELVRSVCDCCRENKLDVILDLHKAYGYDFNNAGDREKNDLFHNPYLQERFVNLWNSISTQFQDYDNVAYELLNEVVEKENALLWNDLIDKTVSAIRKIDSYVPIIYGGIQWNSASTLKLLKIPEDKNIIFTFHFYEPLLFTHQKAYWVKKMNPQKEIFYPESMDYYRSQSAALGEQGEAVLNSKSETMGKEFLEEMVKEAVLAAEKAGTQLYCGEFGVIDQAPIWDTLRWFRDVHAVFEKYQIGCSIWTYKEMDFGLTGKHYNEIREDLIDLWTHEQ
ncbi:glycoside hydrolase family 5 protein [Lacrimispora sp.]|uniref:glycoside hydrolase family 5 protein n=1 Tax=Lacrimispora sp. TaxID=2719234 RepID=UPI0029E28D4F|nr:endoglucanase [Lacrimispora sp.]